MNIGFIPTIYYYRDINMEYHFSECRCCSGASWETIVGYMDVYSNIVYAILAVLIILFVILFIKKRLAKQ